MKNGTQSSKLRLIESSDHSSDAAAEILNVGADCGANSAMSPVLILFTVSVACATAAIAAGSYALWLTRQKAARQTLIDVQDILKICQERMHQMENDLMRLPGGIDSAMV